MKFRKIPVEVEAVQFTRKVLEDRLFDDAPLPPGLYVSSANCHPIDRTITSFRVRCETLEGDLDVALDDWIITGVKGEHYPCRPDIFALTYEPVITRAIDKEV